ncbi:MAG: phosphoglycerate dehydrogenase [Candidatus Lambdaproteobacteria bacterium]|nr:phosphoglycerate dehydrogenase [Candidatus Lambdaproteobacteria bacterium]
MMYRILITGALDEVALQIFGAEKDVQTDYRPDLPYQEILGIVGDYHAIVSRSETTITRELIDRGRKLKVIARAAVGIANIDVDYATEKGILVFNTPGKNTNSAAELTMGLLLAAVRKIIPAHRKLQAQGWDRHSFRGSELLGKTIGIIGLGNVGHRVAQYARAFEMEVLAYDPYIADDVFESYQAHKVSLEELIARADVITIHTPKTAETVNMLDAAAIARMKPGVVLINAARGSLINEQALLEGLKSGHVAAAGIDTWVQEPPKDNPFKDLPQVVMTPHIGASTLEAQRRIAATVAEQTLRALRDEVVDYPVNMPRFKVLVSPRVKSYIVLAEKLGSFAMQSLDFNPRHIQVMYRGELTSEEGAMIRRAFLKGFLKNTAEELVTFVNAEQKAGERGISIEDIDDPGFRDYASAVKFIVSDHDQTFTIGGVVLGENNYRLSLVNSFTFEVIPDGFMLYIINNDRPGVIGAIGTLLGENRVNISQFELSRNMPGGQAMSIIRVDTRIEKDLLDKLNAVPNIVAVRSIQI